MTRAAVPSSPTARPSRRAALTGPVILRSGQWIVPVIASLAFAGLAFPAAPARASVALDFGTCCTSTSSPNFNGTLGWSFTTNAVVTVTALDAYDPTGTGLVELYNALGTVLASATVTTSDTQEGSGVLFYSQPITPIVLIAGTTYYIAEDVSPGPPATNIHLQTSSLTVDPSITYDGGVSSSAGHAQTPTTDALFSGALNDAFFGPNFDLQSSSSAPEPGSLFLLVTGLAGMIVARGRRAEKFAGITAM